jgi:DNA-binding CsgD family transcriptional regulator
MNRREKIDSLTPSELIVLELMAQAQSNDEIALKCNISLHTVKAHINNIMLKFGLKQTRGCPCANGRLKAVFIYLNIGEGKF